MTRGDPLELVGARMNLATLELRRALVLFAWKGLGRERWSALMLESKEYADRLVAEAKERVRFLETADAASGGTGPVNTSAEAPK